MKYAREKNDNESNDKQGMSDFCSILTQESHIDPIGTAAENIHAFLFYEQEKPWPAREKEHPSYPKLPKLELKGIKIIKVHFLAPHHSYSRQGYKRIMFFMLDKFNPNFYHKKDFQVPEDIAEELVTALTTGADLISFEKYEQNTVSGRDFFICGHFNRDYCCGTFGDQLYTEVRSILNKNKSLHNNIRIWQTTHLKGHKFAPTMIDFPEGRFWAHVTLDLFKNAILPLDQFEDIRFLKKHIRGLSSTSRFGQVAERELFIEFGPKWKKISKEIKVNLNKDNKYQATVEINFTSSTKGKQETRLYSVQYLDTSVTIDSMACGSPNTFKKVEITIIE